MNFKTSTQGVTETSKYFGIGMFQPIMINPSKEDLGTFLGRNLEKDLIYLSTKNVDGKDTKQLRIDIWGEIPEGENRGVIKTKITFFLEGRYDIARTGSTRYINGQGIASYVAEGKDIETLNAKKVWYHTASARKAIVGESLLMNFLLKLWNVENRLDKFTLVEDDVPNFFLNTKDLFKGNFTSIQQNFNNMPDSTIKCYFGIKKREVGEQVYYDMEIYNKEFQYSNAKSSDIIINALKDEYTSFKSNVAPISDILQPFDMQAINKIAEERKAVLPDDDLPF